jgi:hypothetical protein
MRAALMARQEAGRGRYPIRQLFGPLLTEQEAADRLNWSKKTLQRRRWLGLPPSCVKLGASVRYPEQSIAEFVSAGFRDLTGPEAA